ncbi:MAG: UDP-N-acetylglucosamine diphosphorylase [Rhabdochlamydiaceae bacterium]|nr:UDP-N-acetylglucosamine diphosphorylase [Candidatus Amphrikana amoebophyrae]
MSHSEFFFEQYFDLRNFKHPQLFKKNCFAWEVLDRLRDYLDGFSNYGIYSEVPSWSILENEEQIYIGKNVTIEPFTLIKGPCIIEDGATIAHGSLVRPYSIISQDALLGHCSEVKESILLEGAKLPHFNYVGDSIIGARVNLGAGLICANVRLDMKEIILKNEEEKCSSGRHKLGAIIGDDSSLSCNLVINPGSFIQKNSFVLSNAKIKTHSPRSKK